MRLVYIFIFHIKWIQNVKQEIVWMLLHLILCSDGLRIFSKCNRDRKNLFRSEKGKDEHLLMKLFPCRLVCNIYWWYKCFFVIIYFLSCDIVWFRFCVQQLQLSHIKEIFCRIFFDVSWIRGKCYIFFLSTDYRLPIHYLNIFM